MTTFIVCKHKVPPKFGGILKSIYLCNVNHSELLSMRNDRS